MIEKIKSPGLNEKKFYQNNLGKDLKTIFSESALSGKIAFNMRGAILAFGFFLYFFVQNGTMGLFPEKWYTYYRSIRLSDLILYVLIIYSFIRIKEYSDLFKSKILLLPKIFLGYLIFEFFWSALSYHFNVIEYFFRLKGIWASFLIFPFLLLLKRGGLPYLIKLIFPFAVLSNVLYIMTAVTGVAFLPDVSIYTLKLPFDLTVYRVYGGTFYGETFLIGFLYFWIMKKFRFYQLFFVILFLIPHLLAFGRTTWVAIVFSVTLMFILGIYYKKNYGNFFRQVVIMTVSLITIVLAFMYFIPDSAHFIDALQERVFQGQEDITYNEGTYDTRVHFQTNSLIKLWSQSNILVGVGMHPMWVVRPENYEEQVWYNAFCDVTWPGVLAAYGLIGLLISLIFQFYYMFKASRYVLKPPEINLYSFFLTASLCSFIFTTFVTYSYNFISTTLWGYYSANFSIAILVYIYDKYRDSAKNNKENTQDNKQTEYIYFNGATKKIKNFRFNPNLTNGCKRNNIQ